MWGTTQVSAPNRHLQQSATQLSHRVCGGSLDQLHLYIKCWSAKAAGCARCTVQNVCNHIPTTLREQTIMVPGYWKQDSCQSISSATQLRAWIFQQVRLLSSLIVQPRCIAAARSAIESTTTPHWTNETSMFTGKTPYCTKQSGRRLTMMAVQARVGSTVISTADASDKWKERLLSKHSFIAQTAARTAAAFLTVDFLVSWPSPAVQLSRTLTDAGLTALEELTVVRAADKLCCCIHSAARRPQQFCHATSDPETLLLLARGLASPAWP